MLSISKVLPVLFNPVPAVICPAPENWENSKLVVPIVIEPSVVNTKPESALIVPSSINVKTPGVTSLFSSKSVALTHEPLLQR